MDDYESLSHTKWECKYHIVFIPKCRRKTLFGQIRQHLGEVFHKLAAQKESRIEEGHLQPDHVHMLISIPPNMRCRKWSAFLRERVPSTSPVCTEKGNEISLAKAFGLEAFSSPPWGVMKP
jgi:REP element-mobilizing transposase RayT